ncbi:MAG: isoprenyl transferase [Candidatus Krumholzibacteriota bacterium]|nr:isoprenyl transferase [Candidatus Krumholzibacteriota bacterium]
MKEEEIENEIEALKKTKGLPEHIAIIMDGNGRWARKRKLPRIAGHRSGRESVRTTVQTCARIGIPVLSLYTFSLENWNRPAGEVKALMSFLRRVLESEFLELDKNNIQLRAMGRLDLLPKSTKKVLDETIEKLSRNDGMILNLCLSYSGRAEIVDSVKGIARDLIEGKIQVDSIDETLFRQYLYSPDLPDPDLLIRSSGELRISNFLLWQIAYSEIFVTDVLWPDFREEHLLKAINEYLCRDRRFGGLKSR